MPYKDKAAAAENAQKYRQANMERLRNYLMSHPCVDCGEQDIVVLEFDHLPDFEKKFEIGRAVTSTTRSWSLIETEIAKCEVVCCNCHRRRSIRRQGGWRAAALEMV